MSGDQLNSNNNTNPSHNPVKLMHSLSPLNQRYVKLNIGGYLYTTSIDTLTREDNMLRAMLMGRLDICCDSEGFVIIDRCGRHFEFLLNCLREDDACGVDMFLDTKDLVELHDILKEAKFYCIQSVVAAIEQKIESKKSAASLAINEPYFGTSVVSMVTSKNELTQILNSSDKPFIRLCLNRHNNKYSYTSSSDDNLLKNIELFERMAIKFKDRIMFIKDTTSTEEICCWYFHGSGRKLAEVCCTSIVYTTEKKQTKVEYPDSRILEEIIVNASLCVFESSNNNNNNNSTNDEELINEMPRISLNQSNCVTPQDLGATGNSSGGRDSITQINQLSSSNINLSLNNSFRRSAR